MNKIGILFATLLALAAQSALAQDYARTGAYVALNGVTSIDPIHIGGRAEVTSGVSGRLGYRLAPRFALESQVEWSGDFVEGAFDRTASTVTANAKFLLGRKRAQPYLLAGIGLQVADESFAERETAFATRLGGGLDYYFSERAGVFGEVTYVIPAARNLDGFDYASAGWGLFYRF